MAVNTTILKQWKQHHQLTAVNFMNLNYTIGLFSVHLFSSSSSSFCCQLNFLLNIWIAHHLCLILFATLLCVLFYAVFFRLHNLTLSLALALFQIITWITCIATGYWKFSRPFTFKWKLNPRFQSSATILPILLGIQKYPGSVGKMDFLVIRIAFD